MPWQEVSVVSQRTEFMFLASQPGANLAELCRRYGISRTAAYKWLGRYKEGGVRALTNQSRKPLHSPGQTPERLEQLVVKVRAAQPTWGGRKIRAKLVELGEAEVPSASTITAILERHGLLSEDRREKRDWQRFEHEAPNRLWQMDFKGHFATEQARCHPLTLLDDHSRFSLCLKACANEQGTGVQQALEAVFRRYGLPDRMTMDNGAPWGSDEAHPYTPLTLWLIRLGIRVSHSRPYHPQTQGKLERFHRTLKSELLNYRSFKDLFEAQHHFDRWRDSYNCERPHEALGMQVPAQRYKPSWRTYPEQLSPIEYSADDQVRKVQNKGEISFQGRTFKVGKAFQGQPVALRPTPHDGVFDVYYCNQRIAEVDLRLNMLLNSSVGSSVNHVPEHL